MSTTKTPLRLAQSGETLATSPSLLASSSDSQLNARLEKAMHRAELLGYAAAGLASAILAFIVIIAFV